MFSALTERLQTVFGKLRSRGRLSEKDVKAALREVRLALLEADVNFKVARDFVARIEQRAVGQEVLSSLTPAQQVIKIVNEELVELLGGRAFELKFRDEGTSIVVLMGLQGSGKTTTAAKLAVHYRTKGKRLMLVSIDVHRPAAREQLAQLARQIDVPCYIGPDDADALAISRRVEAEAKDNEADLVFVDTAGRLHVDEEMMDELSQAIEILQPVERLIVVDAMTGQDALNVAVTFNERLGFDGVVLTKMDGDARGGAALSVKAVTGKPIKFVGVGERTEDLEVFHPERMASRILGMGDVLTLIEKAEAAWDEEKAKELTEKLQKDAFTLEDFLDQLDQVRRMGPLDQLIGMLPGVAMGKLRNLEVDENQLKRVEAIVQSMTPEERRNPGIINGSRRRRIAKGSGTRVQDVNRLLKQFQQTRSMMRQLTGSVSKTKKLRKRLPFFQ